MGRVGRRLTDAIKAAMGERIVAFGRAGKPSENPFFAPVFIRLAGGPGPDRRRTTVFGNCFLSGVA